MQGRELVAALRKKLGTRTNKELADQLGLTIGALWQWEKNGNVTARQVAAAVYRISQRQISGRDLLERVKKKLELTTERELAAHLGMSTMALNNWRRGGAVTARQLANAIAAARESSAERVVESAIRPLAEFYPTHKAPSRGGAKYEILPPRGTTEGRHPYVDGLRNELKAHHGVYVFFDSRGRAIYAGKARRTHLFAELTNAYNRARGAVQSIRTVKHPTRKQPYRTAEEKSRQIRARAVALHDLAAYFSAYVVRDELIEDLESLLVRAFANDLSNVKMERFGQQRRASRG